MEWQGMTQQDRVHEARLDACEKRIKEIKARLRDAKRQGYQVRVVKKELRLFSPNMELLDSKPSFNYYDSLESLLNNIGISKAK